MPLLTLSQLQLGITDRMTDSFLQEKPGLPATLARIRGKEAYIASGLDQLLDKSTVTHVPVSARLTCTCLDLSLPHPCLWGSSCRLGVSLAEATGPGTRGPAVPHA